MKSRALTVLVAAVAFALNAPLAAERSASEPAATAPAPTSIGIDAGGMPVEVSDVEGVERALYRDGRVYIGGQPSEADLLAGYGAVKNYGVPKDEVAAAIAILKRNRVPVTDDAIARYWALEKQRRAATQPRAPVR